MAPRPPEPVAREILIVDSGERFSCLPGENLLRAMERQNRRAIPVGCRGGGCGVCKIRVLRGTYTTRRMSRAHVSVEEEGAGVGLACCLVPGSDLDIEVPGALRRPGLRAKLESHS